MLSNVMRLVAIVIVAGCSSKDSKPASDPPPTHVASDAGWGRVKSQADVRVRNLALQVDYVRDGAGVLVTAEADLARLPAKGSGQVVFTRVECAIDSRASAPLPAKPAGFPRGARKEFGVSWDRVTELTGEDPQHVRIENGTAGRELSGCGVAFRIQKVCAEADARANRCDKSGRVSLGGGCLFSTDRKRWELGDCAKLTFGVPGATFDPNDP
jgi:hypothetical protein